MIRPLKVLILSHSSELGGAEHSMLDLFDYWAKKKLVEPHFVIRIPLKNMVPELKKRKWPYYSFYYTNWAQREPSEKARDMFKYALHNAKAIFALEKLIDKINPDVVMTNTLVSPWAAIAAHFKNKPHVWFVREYGDLDHGHVFELGREKTFQDVSAMSDLVVANSLTLRKHIIQYINPSKVLALYTPFDVVALRQKAADNLPNPFVNKDSLKVVITGKIKSTKGQADAVKAVGILNQQGYSCEICIVGDAVSKDDLNEVKAAARQYGVSSKVHLVGRRRNALTYVARADVGIIASRKEAFGRVTFEYLALGKPVIGANSGATPEMVEDGTNGYLYKYADTSALAAKLKIYAQNKKILKKHSKAASQKAEIMIQSRHNADALYKNILKAANSNNRPTDNVLHYSRTWIDFPQTTEKYLEYSKVISLKRLLALRLRKKLVNTKAAAKGRIRGK